MYKQDNNPRIGISDKLFFTAIIEMNKVNTMKIQNGILCAK